MASSTERRYGVVYLAQRVWDDEADTKFYGHWDRYDHEGDAVEGPGWTNAEAAIAWGQERASVVLIRIGDPPQQYYSAGDELPVGDAGNILIWPPE
jgi:hypothetical protein